MPLYRYEALDRTGNKVVGAMEVADERALATRLAGMGYQPVHVEAARRTFQAPGHGLSSTVPASTRPAGSRLTADERALARTFHQLYISFRAGMPAFQAVNTVAGQVPEKALRQALADLAQGIQNGRKLSELMERHPRLFTRGDVGMVRAGEVGGFLPEAFEALSVQHEQNDTVRRRLRIWLWFLHTNVLSLLLFIPLGFFLKDVFPSFQVGVGLASAGRAFLTLTLPLAFTYFALLAVLGQVRQHPGFASTWHRLLLQMPGTGKVNRLRATAVFSRVLQRLYAAGLPPVTAWETAAGSVPNLFLAERFMRSRVVIEQTARPSAALESTRMMEAADLGLVATGEAAGEIPQALEYLANRYEEETRVALGASVARATVSFVVWSLLLGAIGFGIVMYCYGQGVLKIGEME